MNNLKFILISNLLMRLTPISCIRSGNAPSLISRGRQVNSSRIPPDIPGMTAKMTFDSGQPDATPANKMRMQGDAKSILGKMELPNEKLEAQFSPSRADMMVELRIPTTLQDIQQSKRGPLSAFLDVVQTELAKAGMLSIDRLQLLGIRGEYTRVPLNKSDTSVLEKNNGIGGGDRGVGSFSYDLYRNGETMANQYVIVELGIVPGSKGSSLEPAPEGILKSWKNQLVTPGSTLLGGPLGEILHGASIQSPPVSMSTRVELKNAFKSSVTPHNSVSWTIALILYSWCAF